MGDILGKLFSSEIKVKILNLFFSNPNQEFYQAEIAFNIGVKITTLQYELKSLVEIGLLETRFTKIKTFYKLNPKFIYYQELKNIFLRHRRIFR